MAQDNHNPEEEESTQDSTTSETDAQLPVIATDNSAESGVFININQIQSIDISDRFTRTKTDEGWSIALHQLARVTINFTTSMRKFETVLVAGDVIERTEHDVILLRKSPPEAYRVQRSTSALARTREELLQGEVKNETTVQ